MNRKFESRFEGKSNAGLRAKIRSAVSGHRCGPANAASVTALASTVALTAMGRATLEQVAVDYCVAGGDHKYTCDCFDCYSVNLPTLKLVVTSLRA